MKRFIAVLVVVVMALVSMKEMLCSARREKRALGAFNVANYETALGVFKAAEAEKIC